MKNIETMKEFVIKNEYAKFVRELVDGLGFPVEKAVEYVYDQHTMSNEEFSDKYLR